MLGVFGPCGAIRLADEFTQVENLLRSSGIEADNLASAFMSVQTVANQTRSSLEGTGRLFAVLTRNSESLGASQEQILQATRAVQQSFALSGASVQEAVGATRQLSQALASGQLRGQELNSVLEQAPLIAQAIARELDVDLGRLRELAMQGEVTSNVVFAALLNNAQMFNDAFNDTTTVSYTHLTLPTTPYV